MLPSPKGYPVADNELLAQILSLIEIAVVYRLIKKGANECVKSIKKGIAELVIIANDADPIEIVLHLPLLCEDKGITYVFVDSKSKLGEACGMQRPIIACCIVSGENQQLLKQINFIKNRLESYLF